MIINALRTILLFLILACPVKADPPVPPHVFALHRYGGSGHGCAVNGITITNRHMVDPRSAGDFSPPHKMSFRYEFPDGVRGVGYSDKISNISDVAIVVLDKNPTFYGVLAAGPPRIKEKIVWVEYDFRKRSNIYKARTRTAKVVTVRTGRVYLDRSVTPGASGGCSYNEAGEVIGLITGRVPTEDSKESGSITGLWGYWWNDIVPKKEVNQLIPLVDTEVYRDNP